MDIRYSPHYFPYNWSREEPENLDNHRVNPGVRSGPIRGFSLRGPKSVYENYGTHPDKVFGNLRIYVHDTISTGAKNWYHDMKIGDSVEYIVRVVYDDVEYFNTMNTTLVYKDYIHNDHLRYVILNTHDNDPESL